MHTHECPGESELTREHAQRDCCMSVIWCTELSPDPDSYDECARGHIKDADGMVCESI